MLSVPEKEGMPSYDAFIFKFVVTTFTKQYTMYFTGGEVAYFDKKKFMWTFAWNNVIFERTDDLVMVTLTINSRYSQGWVPTYIMTDSVAFSITTQDEEPKYLVTMCSRGPPQKFTDQVIFTKEFCSQDT